MAGTISVQFTIVSLEPSRINNPQLMFNKYIDSILSPNSPLGSLNGHISVSQFALELPFIKSERKKIGIAEQPGQALQWKECGIWIHTHGDATSELLLCEYLLPQLYFGVTGIGLL